MGLALVHRALDFVKLQQSAMKLHRLDRSRGDFLWWIVTSLVLQARASGARLLHNLLKYLPKKVNERKVE